MKNVILIVPLLIILVLSCQKKTHETTLEENTKDAEVEVEFNTFKGSGIEPYWTLTIEEGMISFDSPVEGFQKIKTPYTEPIEVTDKNVLYYHIETESQLMRIALKNEPCIQSGSGETSSYASKVSIRRGIDIDFTEFTGCGNFNFVFNKNHLSKKAESSELDSACFFDFGTVKSELLESCIHPKDLTVILNPLEKGAMTSGEKSYAIFSEDNSKVEIFLPPYQRGVILDKTEQGNWQNGNYSLISWKGYVLQHNGISIYGGQ